MLRQVHALFLLFLAGCALPGGAAEPVFAQRGYYMTFMRMPTFGLAEWKEMIDCLHVDRGNTLLLWTAGGFRSKKFPVTWEYNREHANVKRDFVGARRPAYKPTPVVMSNGTRIVSSES